MKQFLFSYGTLQKEKVQMELFQRKLLGSADTLQGYTTVTIEIKDESVLSKSEQQFHLIAVPSKNKNDNIKGAVFEITDEELLVADSYETEDYKRISVTLDSGKQAWVYVSTQHS